MPLFRLNVISKKSTTFELVSMSMLNPTSLNFDDIFSGAVYLLPVFIT